MNNNEQQSVLSKISDFFLPLCCCSREKKQIANLNASKQQQKDFDFASQMENFSHEYVERRTNLIYMRSNEGSIPKIMKKLSVFDSKTSNRCHMGVSALHNFSIMAIRRSDFGLLFDKEPCVRAFLREMVAIIKISETRFNFIKNVKTFFKTRLIPGSTMYNIENIKVKIDQSADVSPEGQICAELVREYSWLYTDERYNYIKMLIDNNRIAIITLDITSGYTLQYIKNKVKNIGIKLAAIPANLYKALF